ncbi:MAG: RluA family pseudouridine synthase [Hyphomicrobiales bacterium]
MDALVTENKHIGKRLDVVLAQEFDALSRSRLKDLIKTGQVSINDRPITKPNHRIEREDVVSIKIPDLVDPDPEPENIPLEIVYEDDDLIVINKSANMVVHPAPGNWSGTLVNALLHHCGDSLSGINGVKRPGIVHRLDKETSGLMVVAKNDATHKGLAAQFADHGRTNNLERTYQAIIWSNPPKSSGTVTTRIGRSPNNRIKMAVLKNPQMGRHSVTHYTIVKELGKQDKNGSPVASLIECRLETGRTHQIRVHMAHIGCPLLGDPIYGTAFQTRANKLTEIANDALTSLNRQALHAKMLGFDHPITGEHLKFENDLPKDMYALQIAIEKK